MFFLHFFAYYPQVVDIRSTWNALSPKLACEKRLHVLKVLHELFALVPSLIVNTEDYEVYTFFIIFLIHCFVLIYFCNFVLYLPCNF